MRRFELLAAVAAIGFASNASAADMPVKAPIYKAPVMVIDPWVGPYVGVNIGYSWGPWNTDSNQSVFDFESTTASPKVDGILGGVQAGYNWRLAPQWIWGIEGDIQITGEKASQTWSDPELPPNSTSIVSDFVPRPGGPAVLSSEWKFPWFATLRLRAGYNPAENWLLFVTGGLAVGESKYSFNFSQPGAVGNTGAPPPSGPNPTATSYALSQSSTNAGFAVGGGAEVKLDRHWSVKGEYLYADLGTRTINTTDIDGAPFSVSYKVRDHIARLGLNYAFGGQ
jgi:outer membrane immunogenic protein